MFVLVVSAFFGLGVSAVCYYPYTRQRQVSVMFFFFRANFVLDTFCVVSCRGREGQTYAHVCDIMFMRGIYIAHTEGLDFARFGVEFGFSLGFRLCGIMRTQRERCGTIHVQRMCSHLRGKRGQII